MASLSKPTPARSRLVSVESRQPTTSNPSHHHANELDSSHPTRTRINPNLDKWTTLLTSLGVSVPSAELAESLKSTTYLHSIAEGEQEGSIEFHNPLDTIHHKKTNSESSHNGHNVGMPQPVSDRVNQVFMKWTSSYQEHDSTDDSKKINLSNTTTTSATASATASTTTTTTTLRKNFFVRSVLSKINKSSRQKENTTTLIRQGIPPVMRGTIWELCCGSRRKCHLTAQNNGLGYAALVTKAMNHLNETTKGEIERDIHRTKLKGSRMFANKTGHKKLRRILYAFAIRNVDIGYCQAMNFIAAVFLIHMSEEAAFWSLTSVVEDLVPDYYSNTMIGIRRDSQVFARYLKLKLPMLHAHFLQINLMYEPLIMNWFLQLFVNTLPFHTTLRVWDVFLHEGVKVLFRVGVAIMKELEPKLLATNDFGTLFTMLTEGIDLQRDGQQSSKAARVKMMQEIKNKDNERSEGREEGDALIAMAFRMRDMGSMSTKKLVQMRREVVKSDESLRL